MKKYISFIIMATFILLLCGSVYAEDSNTTLSEDDTGTGITTESTTADSKDVNSLKTEFKQAKESSNDAVNINFNENKTLTEAVDLTNLMSKNIIINGNGNTITTVNTSFITIPSDYSVTLNNINFKNMLDENYTYLKENELNESEELKISYFIRNEGNLTLNNITIDNTAAFYTENTIQSIYSNLTINNVGLVENNGYDSLDNAPSLWIAESNVTINNLTSKNMINFWIMDSNIELNNSNLNFSKSYNERYLINSQLGINNSILRNIRTSIVGSDLNVENSTLDGYYLNNTNSTLTIRNSRLMYANPLYPSAIELKLSDLTIVSSNLIYNGAINKSLIYALNSTVNIRKVNFINNRATSALIESLNSTVNLNNTNFTNNTVKAGSLIYGILTDSNITSSIFEHNLDEDNLDLYYVKSNLNATDNIFMDYADNPVVKIIQDNTTNLNANWWSTNNPYMDKIVEGANVSNWRLLTFLNKTSLNNTPVEVEAALNTLSNGSNATGVLHPITVQFIADSGKFDNDKMILTSTAANVYNGSLDNFSINVAGQEMEISNKINGVLQIDNITVRNNEKIKINILVSDDATGNITFSGYGINYTRKITNSTISFKLNINQVGGIYTFKIRYNGDSKYNSQEVEYKVTILNNQTITPTKTYSINESNITLPSKYDLRDYNQVTSVKDQVSYGNSASFASIAAVESAILKQSKKSYDLSENNMKNNLAKYSAMGLNVTPNEEVSALNTIGYLTSWSGPVLESDDTYDASSLTSLLLNSSVKIQEVYVISNRNSTTDNDKIKEAIIKYGAVYSEITVSQNEDGSCANQTYIYNPFKSEANQAIVIVGWDDNYDKSNFEVIKGNLTYTPSNNGAFIVKNSWSTDIGDNGYFYVSYEDAVIGGISSSEISNYVVIYNKTAQYDDVYQYDVIYDTEIATTNKEIWFNNNYTMENDGIIAAIGTMILNKNYNYTAYVYVNGNIKHSQSGQINTTGYRTIPLTKYISVNKDENVSIVLKITSVDNITLAATNSTLENYSSKFSFDNKTWTNDLDSSWYKYTNNKKLQAAPLKVYAFNNPLITTSTSIENNKLVINTSSLNDVNVTYSINNNTITSNTSQPLKLNITEDMNNSVLLTTYADSNMKIQENKSITLSARIEVSTNTSVVKMGDTITLTAKKIGTNDSSVVIFKLNGVTIKDSNGNPIKVKFTNNVASLNFTIPDGWRQKTLTVTAVTSIDGQRQEENTTFDIVKIGITLNNTTFTRDNNTLIIETQLRDEHSHVVLGQNVFAIKINGVTYKENNKNKYFVTQNSTLTANITIPNSLIDKEFTVELVTGDRYSYLGTRESYTVEV